MNNSEQSKESPKSRVDEVHGGEVVETIDPKHFVSVHDSGCKHDSIHRDYSEKDFIAFVCDNPNCAIVKLFDK